MHPNRRRKKCSIYGKRTVEVQRGSNGFGFTISGQQPCILSCIVANSPADLAGLRAGDFLISVNGLSVSQITHDAVVHLIGNCSGPIRMTIAEHYYSDSSEEELDTGRTFNIRKPKHLHKSRNNNIHQRPHRIIGEHLAKKVATQARKGFDHLHDTEHVSDSNRILGTSPNKAVNNSEPGLIEYKAIVGYLGTIEMPKQLLPSSRLETVCSCIRKLRQEKRVPTDVLMTMLPTCLTLKNSNNHILAIYPINRMVYIGSSTDRDSRDPRYFGIVTSAIGDMCYNKNNLLNTSEVEISNSCHVFTTDPKSLEHTVHARKAEAFNVNCTADITTGNCLEFPSNALYIVNLVQTMYKIQCSNEVQKKPSNCNDNNNVNLAPIIPSSPQPSASSNSDSGIGFRDDCGTVSDRILVVEFPAQKPFPIVSPLTVSNNNRPSGISDPLQLEQIQNNDRSDNLELNSCSKVLENKLQNNLSNKNGNNHSDLNGVLSEHNNLNNIRACESPNIKNNAGQNESPLVKANNQEIPSRLTCRVMPDWSTTNLNRQTSMSSLTSSEDNIRTASLAMEPMTVSPYSSPKKHPTNNDVEPDKQKNIDAIKNVFKVPLSTNLEQYKISADKKKVHSCEHLDRFDDSFNKLSPKVYGFSKSNYSSEELHTIGHDDKRNFGSLQELLMCNSNSHGASRNITQSEPDVRIQKNDMDSNYKDKDADIEGPISWSSSFEKLLYDPLGLHMFAEFLKKEFSAENIYFWTACERYKRILSDLDRTAVAQKIYQQHLCPGAPEPVNVDSQARHCTEQSLREGSKDLFNHAQKQIFNLMKFDSYPRFLKSNVYKKCLAGEIEQLQFDEGLLLHTQNFGPSTPGSKLKKSLSNAEDRRRKSLLPWHKKNHRSKSKDRGESEYAQQQKRSNDQISNCGDTNEEDAKFGCSGNSDVCSSKSSLTSLDLALSQDSSGKISKEGHAGGGPKPVLCRVILNNGSTTVVQIKESETIQQLIYRLLDKRGLRYSSFEVYTDKQSKPVDINESSATLAGCEVTVEQRVVFKIDLPNRKVISVKSKCGKIIVDILKPILLKYNYSLDHARVTKCENEYVDIFLPVTSIDESRLKVHYETELKSGIVKITSTNKATNLDDITNKVFEDILQEKSDSAAQKTKYDKTSVKSEDWGSEHSSGIFGRFLRLDSGLYKKKSFPGKNNNKNSGEDESSNGDNLQARKPLIAKWKTGVNKAQVMRSESDDLVEGLTRAQRSRLEDQRGTEINFELPDFLKDKDSKLKPKAPPRYFGESGSSSQFCLKELDEKSLLTPEYKNMIVPTFPSTISAINGENHNEATSRAMALRPSVTTLVQNNPSEETHSDNSRTGSQMNDKISQLPVADSSPSKCTNLKFTKDIPINTEPPPLPPKPKIVPMKPLNWGQTIVCSGSNSRSVVSSPTVEHNKALFLEQHSSSFV